ncbi:glucose 1-dehydrogenase [Parvibaculum sedimenti]|uniref:Glucose 1-dehydrogenase n=2 Tax=Parvibaculum sedimenti TaxID=2608632 RepID=A0A6N6VEC1_9HYPH|nr:glucose 1-dehydrogenase [Parvibaculum sedimenti]KAB7739051.1 glucose 1-dehydrogenase [Parvibaculum sedimenti]
MTLKDKVSIVTGSATGLGAAVAIKLAERGSRVVINYTKSEKEAKETLEMVKSKGVDAILAQGDVGEDADCRRIAQTAVDKWGRIDVLVNNAGTTQFANHADLEALTAEDFFCIYKVNVVGAYQMIRACAPHMKKVGKGSVVNVSSIAGVTGVGSSVAYAASKGALNTMTLSLARSLAPEIRVNAVCPGFIGTRWFSDRFGEMQYEKIRKQQEATTPLARAGTPEDIAVSVVFFAGEGSDHITGETLMTDAGMHLGFAPLKAR